MLHDKNVEISISLGRIVSMTTTASMYARLPSKFDFTTYYLQQAGGGGPSSFPIYRARQRGGFIAPLLKRHGIPFLKWIGKQAASLATGVGNSYLEKGSLTKADLKAALKEQGKKSARSALDSLKQQVGGGATMNLRRDARLSALIPTSTKTRRGIIAPLHGIRPPFASEQEPYSFNSDKPQHSILKTVRRRRKGVIKKKKSSTKRTTRRTSKKGIKKPSSKKDKKTGRKNPRSSPAKVKRKQKKNLFNGTIFSK